HQQPSTHTASPPLPTYTHPRPPTSTLFPYTTLFRSPHLPTDHLLFPTLRNNDRLWYLSGHTSSSPHRFFLSFLSLPLACFSHFQDRKSTRLNSSHLTISYAVFCLKKKNKYPKSRLLN